MSIWNKILIGLIITVSLPFFYMSARMLKTQKYWRDLAQKYDAAISNAQKEDRVLQEGETIGGEFKPGIEQVRAELNKLTVDRQRVWYNCDPQVSIDRQTHTATITVTVDQPNPSGIANKSILYVFEEAPTAQKGRYLGEFKVTAVADKEIKLEPSFKLTLADENKLAEAKRPWNLYDSLPHDKLEILGQAGDQRPLREYGYLFDVYRMKITELADQEQGAMHDLKMVEETLADAQRQVQFYQKQATIARTLLAKIVRQGDAVKAYLDKIKETLAKAKAAVAKFIEDNKAMAGQIAQIQLDATRRIDQRTRAMAKSSNGEN